MRGSICEQAFLVDPEGNENVDDCDNFEREAGVFLIWGNGSTTFGAWEILRCIRDGWFMGRGRFSSSAFEQIELVARFFFAQACWLCFTTWEF